MCRLVYTIALAGIALTSTVSAAEPGGGSTAAPDTFAQAAAGPTDAVLVLRDGGALTGQVSRRTDRYVVARGQSEISVPVGQVSLVAKSWDDAYQQQRDAIQRPTAEAHLRLAEWCLRNNLGPPAARELIDARGLDPRHPKLALLERRLAVLAAQRAKTATQSTATAPHDATSDEPAPHKELDRLAELAESLPEGALEQFTRKVQPVLVNGCTTSGCHQPGGKQSFQLDRAMLHGLSNRRSTLRNLEATLALVDRHAPQQSDLLVVPREPHGGMGGPVFGPRQEQLATHLADWVAVVTGSSVPDAATTAGQPQPLEPSVYERMPDRLAEPIRRVPFRAGGVQPAVATAGATGESAGVVTAGHEVESLLGPPRPLQYGAQLTTWQAKDPFDPEIFNRRSDGSHDAAAAGSQDAVPATR